MIFSHFVAYQGGWGGEVQFHGTKEICFILDQGTTSSRAMIFDQNGCIVSMAQKEFPQIFSKTWLG